MNTNNYQDVYTIAEVKEEGEIYGYVVCEAYLINENTDTNGTKNYEVVFKKNIIDLNFNKYETLPDQTPIFDENGKCINSTNVNNVYMAFDIAQDASYEENKNLFKKIANDRVIKPSNYGRKIFDLHDLKRALEREKMKLEDRLIDLNIVEKYINNQNKRI